MLQILPSMANQPDLARYHALGYSNLALIARHTGRTEVAVERLSKAYELAKIAYGAEHANTIELLANRAMLLSELERWNEAKATLLQAIGEYELHQGRDFPRLVLPLAQLASIQARFGEYALAKAGCARAMQIAKASFSTDDPHFAQHRYSCARTMLQLGDFAQVETLIRDSAPAEVERPEIAFRNAFMLAELSLLKHDYTLAQTHLVRAQVIHQQDGESLKKELPRLKSMTLLLDAVFGKTGDATSELALEQCGEDLLLCAAQSVLWQRRGRAEQAFTAFEGAAQRLRASKMSLSLFGAYQLLLHEIAAKDRQVDAAKRWQSLAVSSFAALAPNSDWRIVLSQSERGTAN